MPFWRSIFFLENIIKLIGKTISYYHIWGEEDLVKYGQEHDWPSCPERSLGESIEQQREEFMVPKVHGKTDGSKAKESGPSQSVVINLGKTPLFY